MTEPCAYTPKMRYEETLTAAVPTPNEDWRYDRGNLDASYAYDYGSSPTAYDASLAEHIAAIKRACPPQP